MTAAPASNAPKDPIARQVTRYLPITFRYDLQEVGSIVGPGINHLQEKKAPESAVLRNDVVHHRDSFNTPSGEAAQGNGAIKNIVRRIQTFRRTNT